MSFLSFLGFGDSKLKHVLQLGAAVIDVRTAHEYDQGHVRGAINIPLDRIPASVGRIKQMNKPIVFCCTSGNRSGTAVRIMKGKGMKEVYNGGNWEKVIRIQKSI